MTPETALMRCTWPELEAAFPGWRRPSPGKRAEFDATTPPLPYASLDGFVAMGYWGHELPRFYRRVCPSVVGPDAEDGSDVLFPEALIGHGGTFASRTRAMVRSTPARLLSGLAALEFDVGGKGGPRQWLNGSRDVEDRTGCSLAALRDLARDAIEREQSLFLLGIGPPL